ncbi:PP2C family protein-serine/threonine phosphatase [Macromonas nakdongensis]|uniref:PP2C family protein-serine/threonine phosphatase n=1 Tax=Macromonas nakdongensis TaxID=1843082 RepID=UPI000C34731C|nr:protein phosphatase 2C domain-containing protein [Macromonas nakdongensis]
MKSAQPVAPLPPTLAAAPYRIVAATGLDPGDRAYQQDQLALMPHPRHPACVLGVVADGMGGRSGGRKASDQVMLTAQQLFERFDPLTDDPQDLLHRLALEAHTVIRLTAVAAEEEPHSTLAAFLLMPGGRCHWAHSGDSRLYHFRGERLEVRSRDHSYVQSLVDRGELTEAQAQVDPRSNMLLHCLGTESAPVVSETILQALRPGDSLLACSDGLWHYFSDLELGRVVQQLPPRTACELLVQKARERAYGGGDNISLIVLKLLPLTA